MGRSILLGRTINGWAYDLNYEGNVAIVDHMINWLKKLNVNYMIREYSADKKLVDIVVDCDDDTFDILRDLEKDFEYDWSKGMALAY